MHSKQSNKPMLLLSLVALLVIFMVGIGVTYSWIEGGTTYSIQSENESDVNTNILDTSYYKNTTVLLSTDTSKGRAEIHTYDKLTADYQDLFYTPVSSADGENFFLPVYNASGVQSGYRQSTTNDIGNKFVSYEFKVKADNTCNLAFIGKPSFTAFREIDGYTETVDGGNAAIRYMIAVDKANDTTDAKTKYFFTGPGKAADEATDSSGKITKDSVVVTGSGVVDAAGTEDTFELYDATYFNVNVATNKASDHKLYELEKDEVYNISISIWLDADSVSSEMYGININSIITFGVYVPEYTFSLDAVTQNTAGTNTVSSFTGGTITYGSAEYSVKVSDAAVAKGSSFTATAIAKEGYEFAGWYTSASCTVSSQVSTSETLTQTPTSSGVTYYALFKEKDTRITTIYVEPRNYSNYYIYAYGNVVNEAAPTGYTRITVDVSKFNYSNNVYKLYMWDASNNDAQILGAWSGTQLTNKDADGNYYIDIANSKLTAGHNYYGIVNNGSSQTGDIPLTGFTIGCNHTITDTGFAINQTSTKYAGEWNGTLTTYDSATGYYKMSFETEDTGTFYAILSESDTSSNRYPASGVDGLVGELGGTYLFTADNQLIEFDPSTMYTFKVQASSSSAGSVYINSSGTTSMKLRPDQSVNIVATPASGYEFTGWYTSTTYANLISTSSSLTVTPNGSAGSTVTYYAKFTQVSTTDYYIDSSAVSWFEDDGAVLAYSTNGGSSYTKATEVTYNGVSYWKVSVPIGTSSFKISRYVSANAIYDVKDVTVSGTTSNNMYILNSGYTGGCWVHYEVGDRLLFFNGTKNWQSTYNWDFEAAGCVLGIKASGTNEYIQCTKIEYANDEFWYVNLDSSVTQFYMARVNSSGNYNISSVVTISSGQTADLYTITHQSSGDKLATSTPGYFLH